MMIVFFSARKPTKSRTADDSNLWPMFGVVKDVIGAFLSDLVCIRIEYTPGLICSLQWHYLCHCFSYHLALHISVITNFQITSTIRKLEGAHYEFLTVGVNLKEEEAGM